MSGKMNTNKTNLYVKGLWNECSQIDLDDLFRPYGYIMQSRVCGGSVGFVRYENAQQAYAAMLALDGTKPNKKCPRALVVRYAVDKNNNSNDNTKTTINKNIIKLDDNTEVRMMTQENNKNIYIRGFDSTMTTNYLYNICSLYGIISSIKIIKNYAFIRYATTDGAINAIHNLHGKFIPNCHLPLTVKFANHDPFDSNININICNNTNNNIIDRNETVSPTLSVASTTSSGSNPITADMMNNFYLCYNMLYANSMNHIQS